MALDPRSFIKNYSLLVTELLFTSPLLPRSHLGDFMPQRISERVSMGEFPRKSLHRNIDTLQSYGPFSS